MPDGLPHLRVLSLCLHVHTLQHLQVCPLLTASGWGVQVHRDKHRTTSSHVFAVQYNTLQRQAAATLLVIEHFMYSVKNAVWEGFMACLGLCRNSQLFASNHIQGFSAQLTGDVTNSMQHSTCPSGDPSQLSGAADNLHQAAGREAQGHWSEQAAP